MNKKMLILGGDSRQLTVANEFFKDGYQVSLYGFNKEYFDKPYQTHNNLFSSISENEIVVLGLPVSKDNVLVNTPLFSGEISMKDLIDGIDSHHIVIGGMLDEKQRSALAEKGARIFDYFLREELIVRNVIPTVEGAIAIAMEETPYTIHNSNCLICGFGRIGKLLAKVLTGMGANVTVSARKLEDFAWIDCYHYQKVSTDDLKEHINRFDIIFNTIPYHVIDKECLKRIRQDSLIIDLASKPGGVDFKYANLLGVKTIWALSLPEKVIS